MPTRDKTTGDRLKDAGEALKASGISSQPKRGAPMSTRAPAPSGSARSSPPAVSIVAALPISCATQRVALPHAPASPPSAFQMRILTSAAPEGSSRISWSQPTPRFRSAIARARAPVISTGPKRPSITTKSLPSPCIL